MLNNGLVLLNVPSWVQLIIIGLVVGGLGAVGLAMIEAGEPINKSYLKEGEWEIDIAGTATRAACALIG